MHSCRCIIYCLYAPNILDLKDEIVIEEYFPSILQKVPHDVFSPQIEEKDQDISCFSLQDKIILVSPIYDEFLDEEEKIPPSCFVYLRSIQWMCDNSELDFHAEQHCVEFSHPKSVEGIEKPSLKISSLAFIMIQPESVDNIKQDMISK